MQLLSSQSLNPGLRPRGSSSSLEGERFWAVVQLMAAQTPPLPPLGHSSVFSPHCHVPVCEPAVEVLTMRHLLRETHPL